MNKVVPCLIIDHRHKNTRWIYVCYGEKFLWIGVPQQTALTPEINLSQYAIEIKCLTLKDQTLYLIPDG